MQESKKRKRHTRLKNWQNPYQHISSIPEIKTVTSQINVLVEHFRELERRINPTCHRKSFLISDFVLHILEQKSTIIGSVLYI